MHRQKPFIELHEDFEREHLKDLVYLQAQQAEEEQRIMKEINDTENRLPAIIKLVTPVEHYDELKINSLPF
jgi:hypothetical protein